MSVREKNAFILVTSLFLTEFIHRLCERSDRLLPEWGIKVFADVIPFPGVTLGTTSK